MPSLDLANYLGVAILTPSEIQNLPEEQMDRLLGVDKSLWSGATFKCWDKHFIIHNNAHAQVRIESTIMHEIAHILCGHEPTIPLGLGNMSLFLRDYNEEHEKEANWLGACLQLPREGLVWALRKGMSIDQIASNYCASIAMTNYRVGVSGAKIQIERAKKYYRS